jgi:hypothetical protein
MKKTMALLLVISFALAMLAGCGAPATLKTGMAVVTSLTNSKDAGEADGRVQGYSTVVAVTIDGSGKIVSCVIDAAQTNVVFTKEGKLVTAKDAAFKSKNELGTEYGMGKASPIKKEWNEQAAAFAKYVVGKTVAQVKGIALKEGVPSGSDLTSSVTIHVTDFITAIEKAVAGAQDLGAKAGDTLGLGIVTSVNKSVDAGETPGLAQVYNTYAATTFAKDGKVTSCVIDASQANVNFDTTGKITTDLSIAPKTKNELGAAYGMKAASKIGKEWNEQAAAFGKYVAGKTLAQIKGIALNAGVPSGTDLTSSVTIHVTDFITLIEKCAATAK